MKCAHRNLLTFFLSKCVKISLTYHRNLIEKFCRRSTICYLILQLQFANSLIKISMQKEIVIRVVGCKINGMHICSLKFILILLNVEWTFWQFVSKRDVRKEKRITDKTFRKINEKFNFWKSLCSVWDC